MTNVTSIGLREPRNWAKLIAVGALAGVLSGMFGIGGGIVVVPLLTFWLHLHPKVASGTSLLMIVLPSLSGVALYGIDGHVDVLAALLLAAGSVLGAPVGVRILLRLPTWVVQVCFVAFLLVIAVSMLLVVPSRDAVLHLGWGMAAGLVAAGFATGILSGLLGIGGGVIVVPLLVLVFGANDLVAKGSSLLMITATGLSGTISNVRRKNVDIPTALVIGVAAVATTALGVWIAETLPPAAANALFAVFLALIIVRTLVDAWRRRRASSGDAG